jgi:uncharacterized membrane protein YbhN (UPF0104 family)
VSRRILLLVLKYGLGLGVLAWVIARHWHIAAPDGQDVGLAAALDRPIRLLPLLAACLLTVVSLSLTVVRWYLLVRAQQLPFTLTNAFRLGLIGYAVSTFLPGSLGGDLLKAAFIAREQERRTAAVATVLFDRVVGMSGLYSLAAVIGLLFAVTGLLAEFVPDEASRALIGGALTLSGALAAGLFALWLALRYLPESWSEAVVVRVSRIPKAGPLFVELWRAAWMYRDRGRTVGVAWLLSLANHASGTLTVYLAALTLVPPDDIPPLAAHYLIVPIGNTVQASFPAPGGVGGGEFTFGFLYQCLGAPFAAGVLAALVTRAITWAVGFAGYLVYLRMRPQLRVMANSPSSEPEARATG